MRFGRRFGEGHWGEEQSAWESTPEGFRRTTGDRSITTTVEEQEVGESNVQEEQI